MKTIRDEDLLQLASSVEILGHRFLEGWHGSRHMGLGLEFESLSPYSSGDDIRTVDWKKLAATDRTFVRRKHPEKKNHWRLIMDRSPSMSFGAKWNFLQLFVGSLLVIFRRWGDSWVLESEGFTTFDEILRSLLEGPRSTAMPLAAPRSIESEGPTSAWTVYISDFMFEPWASRERCERTLGLQILDEKESQFPFHETLEFRDMESTEKILLPTSKIRDSYERELRLIQADWKERFHPGHFLSWEAHPESVVKSLELFFETVEGA